MKLIAPITLASAAFAQDFADIGYKLQSAASEMASLFVSDAAFTNALFSHGCWCAKLGPEMTVGLGGNRPVDELDQLCKDWARARRCTRTSGANCENQVDSTYQVEYGASDVQLCPDNDACLSETCQIDVHFVNAIEAWRVANPGFVATTNPSCTHRPTSNMLSCDAFPVTERPSQTDQGTQDALDDAGVDNTGKNIAVTLSWVGNGNYCDFDLWVADPSGEDTGYSNNPSSSGGSLDVDQAGSSSGVTYIENISWASAASGNYDVRVHVYSGCSGISEVNLYVQRDGGIEQTVLPITTSWNQGPQFFYQSSSRRVLAAYTGPKPDYNAPKN